MKVEMSWVEVDGAGWRWVHSLVIPIPKKFAKFTGKHLRQSLFLIKLQALGLQLY